MAPHHKISKFFAGDVLLWSIVAIHEADCFAIGDSKTPIDSSCWMMGFGCWRGQKIILTAGCRDSVRHGSPGSAGSWIDRFVVARVRSLGCALHILARANTGEQEAGSKEVFKGGTIQGVAFALAIRAEGTSLVAAFLPSKAEPPQVFENRGKELRFAAHGVQVFVSQNQRATDALRALLGCPESPRMSKVHQSGWGWRQWAAILIFGVCWLNALRC